MGGEGAGVGMLGVWSWCLQERVEPGQNSPVTQLSQSPGAVRSSLAWSWGRTTSVCIVSCSITKYFDMEDERVSLFE